MPRPLAVIVLALVASVIGPPAVAPAADVQRPQTIPALRSWTPSADREAGTFRLREDARVVIRHRDRSTVRREARQLAADLGVLLRRRVGTTARRGVRARTGDIVMGRSTPEPRLGDEGYRLRIGRAFTITAATDTGLFHGGRSLLQLVRGGADIPRGRAWDAPRYPERGMMVDAGRKPYSPEWLAAHIRELAYLKLNYLHLHLSDHQGFRIQSDTHPEIVSAEHLTKQQVRELLALAARHHVTIVPEIDMPGHLTAALAVHPEFQLRSATGAAEAGVLDVGNPAAVRFAHDLVTEYLQLFPGRYYHVGGDEVLPFFVYPLGLYPSLDRVARERYGPTATAKDAIHGFINDLDALVRRAGRTTRMWHDDVGGGTAVTRNSGIVAEWWIDVSPLSDIRPPTPRDLLGRGHRIMNAGWFPTYHVNGVGGSPVPITPDLRTAYETWDVHEFHGPLIAGPTLQKPPDTVDAGEPRNLGTKLHLWNDNPGFATQEQDALTIAPGLRVIAQKAWESPPLTPSYAAFAAIAGRVGSAPGFSADYRGDGMPGRVRDLVGPEQPPERP